MSDINKIYFASRAAFFKNNRELNMTFDDGTFVYEWVDKLWSLNKTNLEQCRKLCRQSTSRG